MKFNKYAIKFEVENGKSVGRPITATEQFALPSLAGSEKQISWAADIREKFFFQILTDIAQRGGAGAEAAEMGMASVVAGKVEAKFWIENRDSLRAALASDYKAAFESLKTVA